MPKNLSTARSDISSPSKATADLDILCHTTHTYFLGTPSNNKRSCASHYAVFSILEVCCRFVLLLGRQCQ